MSKINDLIIGQFVQNFSESTKNDLTNKKLYLQKSEIQGFYWHQKLNAKHKLKRQELSSF